MLAKKISFIGFGRMGGALAAGALEAGAIRADRVTVFDPDPAALRRAARLKFKKAATETDAVRAADIVFLCVKPQQMDDTLVRISGVAPSERQKRCFVSIAAGVPIGRLQDRLGGGVPVIRVMPNTPALLRKGASALSRGASAKAAHEKMVREVIEAVGDVVAVEERFMDAVTAVSGSGPAYVFYLAEAMTAAAESLGIDADVAARLVRQTIFGAGAMLHEREESALELRQQVTSPGGTTAAAIGRLDEKACRAALVEAIRAAAARSAELSKI